MQLHGLDARLYGAPIRFGRTPNPKPAPHPKLDLSPEDSISIDRDRPQDLSDEDPNLRLMHSWDTNGNLANRIIAQLQEQLSVEEDVRPLPTEQPRRLRENMPRIQAPTDTLPQLGQEPDRRAEPDRRQENTRFPRGYGGAFPLPYSNFYNYYGGLPNTRLGLPPLPPPRPNRFRRFLSNLRHPQRRTPEPMPTINPFRPHEEPAPETNRPQEGRCLPLCTIL
jgi:hypothetical protein